MTRESLQQLRAGLDDAEVQDIGVTWAGMQGL